MALTSADCHWDMIKVFIKIQRRNGSEAMRMSCRPLESYACLSIPGAKVFLLRDVVVQGMCK